MPIQMLSRRPTAEFEFSAKFPLMWISPGYGTVGLLVFKRVPGKRRGKTVVNEAIEKYSARQRRPRRFELDTGFSYEFRVSLGTQPELFEVASLRPGRYSLSVSVPCYLGLYAKPNSVIEICLRGPGFEDRRRFKQRWWRLVADRK